MLIGVSYPGAVVSWYQHVFNDATLVWSSSATLLGIEEFSSMDYAVYEATNKSAGCKEMVKNITDYIDSIWEKNDKREIRDMIKKFGGKNPDIVRGDFMYYIADIFMVAVQNGKSTKLCDRITSENFKHDPMTKLFEFGKELWAGFSVENYDSDSLANTTYDYLNSRRQWTY